MAAQIFKWLKRVFLGFILVLMLFVLGGFLLIYFKADRVKFYITQSLEEQSQGKVLIDKIGDLSLFHRPGALSFSLHGIQVKGLHQKNKHQLLQASHIFMDINIWDLIQDKLKINALVFKQAELNIHKNKNGVYNFTSDQHTGKALLFDTDRIVFEDCIFSYSEENKPIVRITDLNGELKGDFFAEEKELNTTLTFLYHKDLDFLSTSSIPIAFKGVVQSNQGFKHIVLNQAQGQVFDLGFILSGGIDFEKATNFDLQLTCKDLLLEEITSVLSEEHQQNINRYALEFKTSAKAEIKGALTDKYSPSLMLKAQIGEGQFTYDTHQANALSGQLEIKSDNILDITSYQAHIENINGEYQAMPFKISEATYHFLDQNADIHLQAKDSLPLAFFQSFITQDTLKIQNGMLIPDVRIRIPPKNQNQNRPIHFLGHVELKNVEATYLKQNTITGLHLKLDIEKKDAPISSMETLQFSGSASVNHLIFKAQSFKDLRADITLKNRQLNISQVKTKAYDGQINLDASYYFSDRKLHLTYKAAHIDLTNLFDQMNDFDQNTITHKNIEGYASISGVSSFLFDKNLDPDLNSLYTKAHIEIEKGKLKKIEAFEQMCDYIDQKRLYRRLLDLDALRKSTKHINFLTLENQIEIKHQRVHIPAMRIASSVLDFSFSGTHTFTHKIDYDMVFYLSDLMRKKEAKYEEFEIQTNEKKWFLLALKATGDASDPDFTLNKKNQAKIIKEKLNNEKQIIKTLIKEEKQGAHKAIDFEDEPSQLEFDHPMLQKNEKPKTSEHEKEKKKKWGIDFGDDSEEEVEVDIDNL